MRGVRGKEPSLDWAVCSFRPLAGRAPDEGRLDGADGRLWWNKLTIMLDKGARLRALSLCFCLCFYLSVLDCKEGDGCEVCETESENQFCSLSHTHLLISLNLAHQTPSLITEKERVVAVAESSECCWEEKGTVNNFRKTSRSPSPKTCQSSDKKFTIFETF